MKSSLLFILVALATAATAVGNTVEGAVVDPAGIPVSGARLEIDGGIRTTWSDGTGSFRFVGVAAGPHVLRAVAEDFETVETTITVEDGSTPPIRLQFVSVRRVATSVEVVGDAPEAIQEIPGAVFLVSPSELGDTLPLDANEVLRRVPGVNLREDSGPVAMRLNVGFRGLNPDRSRRVLMLEDGLPIALAPYGEPEMYYSPPIDRMKKVEVVKGSGQILYGPQTIGGVINFVTPEPPASLHGTIDLERGQRGLLVGQASLGSSNRKQSAGFFANYLHKEGDGFRQFYFNLDDLQGKIILRPSQSQTLSLKLGAYQEKSNSTYLGLTTAMFAQDPNQNPVPSDLLLVRRLSGSMAHAVVWGPRRVWNSSLFSYDTTRDWRRQDFDRSDRGYSYLAIVGDQSVPGGAIYLRNSAGNRNRHFRVLGAQTGLRVEQVWGNLGSKLDVGTRYVHERADDTHINGARFDASTGVVRDDEDRGGRAFSGYLQDRLRLTSRLVVTPGVRVEHYQYNRHILRRPVGGVPSAVNVGGGRTITQAVPGIGISYNLKPSLTLFSGAHRGFAPPRVKDAITSEGFAIELDAELSWNYEAGVRYGTRGMEGEFTAFRLNFSNEIIPAALSGGATTTLVNAGRTVNQGLESRLRVTWSEYLPIRWQLYSDVRHTYLPTANFAQDPAYGNNRLPYAPRHILAFLLGARHRQGWGLHLDGSYVGSQFSDNQQTVPASADGTVGVIPGYRLWNLSLDYALQKERFRFRPYFVVKNVANAIYISSRAPQGIQPGPFRQVNVGLRLNF